MPMRQPKAMPSASTAKVCMVSGTGMKGISILAEMVSSREPTSSISKIRSGREILLGQSDCARVG